MRVNRGGRGSVDAPITGQALERILLRSARWPRCCAAGNHRELSKQNQMSVDTDLKAGLILEDFGRQLSDAVIDYHFAGGNHEFTIQRGDVTYQVDFPERVLLEHQIRDLEKVVPQIIDRLLSTGGPRRIKVGDDGVSFRR